MAMHFIKCQIRSLLLPRFRHFLEFVTFWKPPCLGCRTGAFVRATRAAPAAPTIAGLLPTSAGDWGSGAPLLDSGVMLRGPHGPQRPSLEDSSGALAAPDGVRRFRLASRPPACPLRRFSPRPLRAGNRLKLSAAPLLANLFCGDWRLPGGCLRDVSIERDSLFFFQLNARE